MQKQPPTIITIQNIAGLLLGVVQWRVIRRVSNYLLRPLRQTIQCMWVRVALHDSPVSRQLDRRRSRPGHWKPAGHCRQAAHSLRGWSRLVGVHHQSPTISTAQHKT